MEGYIDKAFSPCRIAGLTLRNRFLKTATYEGMIKDGKPQERFFELHSQLAEKGVALTTVAYGAVNADGLTHEHQMVLDGDAFPFLEKLGKQVHNHGGAVSIQLTHCGFFTKSTRYGSRRPLSPSPHLNKYGLLRGRGISKSMNEAEMNRTSGDFGRAAGLVKAAGLDAVEIHMGHGYLLSQFLSPGINKRTDRYGGTLENRLRFPLDVIRSVRKNVGVSFPVICKINLEDGFRGGLPLEESVKVSVILEKEGVNALVLSGGYTSRTPFFLMRGDVPLKQMVRAEKSLVQKMVMAGFGRMIIRRYPFSENFFLPLALKVRERVSMPLCYVGGVVSARGIEEIMREGFDLVAIGRALIHDPEFLIKVRNNPLHLSECNQCNECVSEMERNGIRCVLRDP